MPGYGQDDELVVSGDQPAPMAIEGTVAARAPSAPHLSLDDLTRRWRAKGYPPAAARGIALNMIRESEGDPSAVGDDGTSGGLFQHHAERLAALKAYAKDQGKAWTDPAVQIDFAESELRSKFPELRKDLLTARDAGAAEEQFKRIFERPASVMWASRPGGGPVLSGDNYRYDEAALARAAADPSRRLMMMRPGDYLAMTPPISDGEMQSPAGRSLLESLAAGEPIGNVPTLDLAERDGTTRVVDQDGRHRALLGEQAGVDAIPVAVSGMPAQQPSEVIGMTGQAMPFHAAPGQSPAKGKGGLLSMLIPSAEAAEVPKPAPASGGYAAGDEPVAEPAAGGGYGAGDEPVTTGDQRGILERFGTGVLDVGNKARQLLSYDPFSFLSPESVRQGEAELQARLGQQLKDREARIQAARGGAAGPDWWRLGGEAAATLPLALIGGGPTALARIGSAMLGGGLASALSQPATSDDPLRETGQQFLEGAAGGGLAGSLGETVASFIGPKLRQAADYLLSKGITLTPGQMAGGLVKRAEEAMKSIPVLDSAIRSGERRALESFNRVAVNEALSPIGLKVPEDVAGRSLIGYGQDQLSRAYEELLPQVRLRSDTQFAQDMVDLRTGPVTEMPRAQQQQFDAIIGNRLFDRIDPRWRDQSVPRSSLNRSMDGKTLKEVESELTNLARNFKASPDGAQRQLGDAIDDANNLIRDNLARQNPAQRERLRAINEAYARFQRVQGASIRRGTSDGIFTPGDLLGAIKSADKSRGKRLFARGDALMQELADNAQGVIGNRMPDSGTPERMLWDVFGAGGAWMLKPELAIGAGLASLPYTSPAMRLANAYLRKATAPPGPARNALIDLARGGGQFGAPAAGLFMGAPGPPPGQQP